MLLLQIFFKIGTKIQITEIEYDCSSSKIDFFLSIITYLCRTTETSY